MDIIAVSDIRSVRDGGGPSEEEPAFIPNSFVVEEVHGCCWFFFTDTPETKVRPCTVLIDPNLKLLTGEGDGHITVLSGRPQCQPPLKLGFSPFLALSPSLSS